MTKKSKKTAKSKGSAGNSAKDLKSVPAAAAKPIEAESFSEALRVGGGVNLFEVDARSTPAFDGGKAAGQKALAALAGQNSELQERLYAESKMGGRRSLLSWCRAWTPRARAASCAMSSARWTRRV